MAVYFAQSDALCCVDLSFSELLARETSALWSGHIGSCRLKRFYETRQEARRVRANLATLRYRNGLAGYLEVLDAERALFAAEQQTVATRREQLANAVNLYVALGGGVEAAGSAGRTNE